VTIHASTTIKSGIYFSPGTIHASATIKSEIYSSTRHNPCLGDHKIRDLLVAWDNSCPGDEKYGLYPSIGDEVRELLIGWHSKYPEDDYIRDFLVALTKTF